MFKFLENQKYPVILGALGFILTIVSYFEVEDITKLQISRASSPVLQLYLLGIALIFVSVILYISEQFDSFRILGTISSGWPKLGRVKRVDSGLNAVVNQSVINIVFGRIEVVATDNIDAALVVLPANEFFDDECIHDKRSALGAFIQAEYPNQTVEMQCLIKNELERYPSQSIEKEANVFQLSYGIGTGVYLDQPLSSKNRILFLSVTTKRAGQGLRAEMSYIFEAVNEVQRVVADKRLKSVYIPVIGSGHGGLMKEIALFGMLLAVCGILTRPSGQHIKEFNIIVFKKNKESRPSIPLNSAERLLKITTGMFSK